MRLWSSCLIALLCVGCAASKAEQQADRAVADFFAGDYTRSAERLRPLAEKTNENFVLNNLRLGSAALLDYDLDESERAFLRAYEVLNSFGVNDGGRTLGAVLVDEKIKIWRGEPYERAMANFYLGLVYYIRQDYENARGAFENALFKLRDYAGDDKKASKDESHDVESNFAVAALMLGKCWQKLGREDLAKANLDRAVELAPRLRDIADYDRNLKSNMLLVIDYGHAPQKVTDFDGALVGFAPSPQQAGPLPQANVSIDGKLMNVGPSLDCGPPTIDTVAMAQDRRWQSIDTIRTVKSVVGTGMIAAGAYEGLRGASGSGSAQRRDLIAAAALLGTGLLLKATSQADVRQWEMLPRTVYVVPLHVPPGKHDVVIEFPGVGDLRQEWHGLIAPESGETTYFVRMQRYNSGPFNWPPHSSLQDEGANDRSQNEAAPADDAPAPRKHDRHQS
jgi:tetratricopeptide (TPR) repeat protein